MTSQEKLNKLLGQIEMLTPRALMNDHLVQINKHSSRILENIPTFNNAALDAHRNMMDRLGLTQLQAQVARHQVGTTMLGDAFKAREIGAAVYPWNTIERPKILEAFRVSLRAVEQLEHSYKNANRYNEVLNNLPDKTLKTFQMLRDAIPEPLNSYKSLIFDKLNKLPDPQSFFKDAVDSLDELPNLPEFELDADQNLSIDGEIYEKEDLTSFLRNAAEELTHYSISSFKSFLQKLNSVFDRLTDTKLKNYLLNSITAFLISYFFYQITAQPVNNNLKPHSSNEKKLASKKLKKSARVIAANGGDISPYRYVTAFDLEVKMTPSNSSDVEGILYYGDVIVLLEKGRHWSLIEWEDGDLTIEGYVFSRYLQKLN